MVPASSVSKGAEGMITEEEAERRRNQIRRGRALNAARKEMATREGREARKARRGRALKGGGGGDDDGEELPTEWLNPPFGSFDDFKSSMLILYIAATGDGWEEFMWSGMDATGPGTAPERNDFSAASTFFLAWMIVGCFISLNLFFLLFFIIVFKLFFLCFVVLLHLLLVLLLIFSINLYGDFYGLRDDL